MLEAARMRILTIIPVLFTWLICCCLCPALHAQENEPLYIQGRKYISLRTASLEKYHHRLERTQQRLLQKLQRREKRLAQHLQHTDSNAYARLGSQSLSFDSIRKLSRRPDTGVRSSRFRSRSGQRSVDSLKGICQFLQSKAGQANGLAGKAGLQENINLPGYEQQLNGLQQRLDHNQYINELITQHGKSLESIAGKAGGITGIQKELFYARSKMKAWQQVADEPSKAEELALEYLQGTRGFEQSMHGAMNGGQGQNMANATSAEDLEKMGFQTKKMLNNMLQQKFGDQLSSVQGNMGKQVGEWQDKVSGLDKDIRSTRQSLQSVKKAGLPDFKVNPMRGLPFRQRLEKQYAFNTRRATTLTDGTRSPALLSLSAGLAYKHRPKLKSGIALAGDLGLGESWSAIRFSFEGIGVRAFVNWELIYGVGLYGGYERTWRQYAFTRNDRDVLPATLNPAGHLTNSYSEAVLLGLSKQYRINSKWNGAIQVLYDVWWRDKGLRSPVVLRFMNIQ